jgi:hypothetical protein
MSDNKKHDSSKSKKIILPELDEIKPIDEPEKPFSIEEIYSTISPHTPKIKLVSDLGTEKISTIFNIVALTRKKKYGSKESIKLAENNEECIDASLSITDNLIFYPRIEFKGEGRLTKAQREEGIEKKFIIKSIQSGLKHGVSIDENGDFVKKKDIDYYDENEEPLPVYQSDLYSKYNKTEIKITELADIEEILDTNIVSRYILFPIKGEYDEDFKTLINNMESMVPPRFLSFKFNYRTGTNQKDAYLLNIEEKEMEYILMCIGEKMDIKWVGLEELPEESFYYFDELDLNLDMEL